MAALTARHPEFLLAGPALSLPATDGGRTARAIALDFVQAHLARLGVRQADDDHAVMQQGRMECQDRAGLAARLAQQLARNSLRNTLHIDRRTGTLARHGWLQALTQIDPDRHLPWGRTREAVRPCCR